MVKTPKPRKPSLTALALRLAKDGVPFRIIQSREGVTTLEVHPKTEAHDEGLSDWDEWLLERKRDRQGNPSLTARTGKSHGRTRKTDL
jgi:hypothetical protein